MKEYDVVERPEHYASGSIESIDAMVSAFGVEQVRAFCKINAFKYIWRCDKKNHDEDVKKAIWYLNKYISLGENRNA